MKTIILYGMRGTGKSTIGKQLSQELGYEFIDLDQYISTKNNQALSDYIDIVGWNEFRDEENKCLKEVLQVGDADLIPLQGRVISLGGGTIVFERNRKEIFKDKHTKIIYLDTDLGEIANRISQDEQGGEKRNSLTGKSVFEELEEVYKERKSIYENSCDFSVDNNETIDQTVAEIVYKLRWGGICIPLVDRQDIYQLYEDLERDRQLEYIELRLDLMGKFEYEVLRECIERCPKKCICTLRHENEGGEFNGTQEEQIEILQFCLESGADYVDIELKNLEAIDGGLVSHIPKEKLILSFHHFEKTPDIGELQKVLERMRAFSPAVYKIACMPQSLEDVTQMYDLLEYVHHDTERFVFISMGELGLSTRVEMPKCGSLLSFGSYGENMSAPGQMNYRELHKRIFSEQLLFGKKLLDHDMFTLENLSITGGDESQKLFGNMSLLERRVLFLGTSQISGSYSPFMHNLSSSDLPLEKQFFYTLAPSSQEAELLSTMGFQVGELVAEEFIHFIESSERFVGANVTMPYKRDVYEYLNGLGDERLDINSQLAGAVNTLYKKDGKVYATNTDIDGVKLPILEKLVGAADLLGLSKDITSCYIFGAGGAARAAVAAMIQLGVNNIIILNRTKEKLDELADHFRKYLGKGQSITVKQYDVTDSSYSFFDLQSEVGLEGRAILINTLPFGFKEGLPESPIKMDELERAIKNVELYFEAVYDAQNGDTPIVQKIGELDKNVTICRGVEMLIYQAKVGFELWSNGGEFKTEELKNILL